MGSQPILFGPEIRSITRRGTNEEYPTERAVRQHLQQQGLWNESLEPSEVDGDGSADAYVNHVDHCELFITSRPWYKWQLEAHQEEVRLNRHPETRNNYYGHRENATARWKEKGTGKIGSWGDFPGWKWRHQSPSPEPADPITWTSRRLRSMRWKTYYPATDNSRESEGSYSLAFFLRPECSTAC